MNSYNVFMAQPRRVNSNSTPTSIDSPKRRDAIIGGSDANLISFISRRRLPPERFSGIHAAGPYSRK